MAPSALNRDKVTAMGDAFAFFCWVRLEYPFLTSAGHYQPAFNRCALDAWLHLRSVHAVSPEPR